MVRSMEPDVTGLSGSVARMIGVEKVMGSTQRASEIAQDQLASESLQALNARAPGRTNGVSREKIRRDRETRRRERERRLAHLKAKEPAEPNDGTGIDLIG